MIGTWLAEDGFMSSRHFSLRPSVTYSRLRPHRHRVVALHQLCLSCTFSVGTNRATSRTRAAKCASRCVEKRRAFTAKMASETLPEIATTRLNRISGTSTRRRNVGERRPRMTSSLARKHATPGPATDLPPLPEPSFAERAHTLVHLGRMGSLSTLSRKHPGFPFGSVMPYGLDDHGHPIVLISTLAMHTQNLQADPHASLLVTQQDTEGEPLGASRVTLLGNVLPVPTPDVPEARRLYLECHANSKYWADFEDFSFYRMDVVDVYYVGGFGIMGWVSASDYDHSQPDPIADSMAEIIQHMNADHKDALVMLARTFAHMDSTEASMTAVDRLGFHVRLKTPDGVRGARIAFLQEVRNATETRKVLVEMVRQSRSQAI
jgi:putative heme iron utilization protein